MTRSQPRDALSPVGPRAQLMLGVSLAAMASAWGAGPAAAQSMAALRAATGQGGSGRRARRWLRPAAASGSASSSAAMAAAAARAQKNQSQVSQTLTVAQQAQAAARAAALAMHPQVPDGLAVGGLQVVANPVPAASDPIGVRTWQGANLPTASAQSQSGRPSSSPRRAPSCRGRRSTSASNTTLTFQQQQGGVAQPSWVVLNRVVGQLNPLTGLRDPNQAPAPSQILGSIKADGTVLVINQNGVIFGPTAQVNVQSLVATSLEIGHALETVNEVTAPLTLSQRDNEFLTYGLLGYADQLSNSASFQPVRHLLGPGRSARATTIRFSKARFRCRRARRSPAPTAALF